jgi:N-acyl-D-amino-acid deacylase
LGRVIEKVSEQTYEAYVQQHVLRPIGIGRMRIGGTRLGGRIDGEVRYYDTGSGRSVFADDLGEMVPQPYGAWHLEAMDSHGGWLASAVDLARFAAAFDDPDKCPILSRASIEAMFARPSGGAGFDQEGKPKEVFYSLGWQVRDLGDGRFNRWHTGSLPGTTTIMVHRHDGRNFVGLLNTRVSPTSESLGGDIDQKIGEASQRVESWPRYDLFDVDLNSDGSSPVP